ncbi:MAG: serine/threonine-protein kinase, partial [bacterium]
MQKFFVPRADRKLGDRYELLECLGDGSYGWVWTATRLKDQAVVALKIPKEQGGSNETLAEGKALLNQAHHENVVAVNWMGRVPPDRQWYVIEMEYFPSSTLAQVFESQDSPFAKSYKALLAIYEQVLCGVAFLHGLGIAHGDIKPHNILVAGDRVKITDFGSSVQPDEMYVRTRENGGTILYSAPERLGYFGTDPGVGGPLRGDIYSLGVLLYYLSTSRTPHATFTQAARCAPFPDPSELNSSVSPALAEFTMRCLQRRPEDRWPSVAEMLAQWAQVRHAQLQYAPLRATPKAIGETQDWSSRVLAYFEKREYSRAVRVAESEFLATNEPHALLLLLTSLYKDGKFFDCARRIEGYPLLFAKGAPLCLDWIDYSPNEAEYHNRVNYHPAALPWLTAPPDVFVTHTEADYVRTHEMSLVPDSRDKIMPRDARADWQRQIIFVKDNQNPGDSTAQGSSSSTAS